MRIGGPARRRGVPDGDSEDAVVNIMRRHEMGEGLTFSSAGIRWRLLDFDGEHPVAIHAMVLRPKFCRFPG